MMEYLETVAFFSSFVPPTMRRQLSRDERVARGVCIRNRQLWMKARRDYAVADVERSAPDLAGIERARAIRRHARALVAAGDGDALNWIRLARTRRTR